MTIKRALIVDDSTTAQYRLKKMLRRYPLDIDIVDSGEAALRYLARHAPAVIFMDHLISLLFCACCPLTWRGPDRR